MLARLTCGTQSGLRCIIPNASGCRSSGSIWQSLGEFSFRAPDETRWPALRLAREVMARGGLAGAVFNAAKETALDGFIAGHIGFMDMADVVAEVLDVSNADHIDAQMTLDNVLQVDHLTREATRGIISKKAG